MAARTSDENEGTSRGGERGGEHATLLCDPGSEVRPLINGRKEGRLY